MSHKLARNTVLVVDDEPQVLAAIEDTLEAEYRVVLRTSSQAALRVVEEESQLSVILSDQRMPGMTGDEFLARAKDISDATRLIVTGYADLEAVVRAVNNGHIFGYISKPWDPQALRLAVFKAAEHHRLQRDLAEEQRLLRNLMDSIPDAVFFKDLEQRFLRLNKSQARLLGVERPEDAVGRPTRDFFLPEQARERELEDVEVMRGKVLVDKVRRVALPGGGSRWSSTTKAPIRDEKGRITGLVGVARDITERWKAEERVRRLSRVHAIMSAINGLIVRATDPNELYREACRIAVELGKFPGAWIGEVDRQAMRVSPVASHGVNDQYLDAVRMTIREDAPEGVGPVGRAVIERTAMLSNDIGRDPRIFAKGMMRQGVRSLVVLPLAVEHDVVGVFVMHSESPNFFDEEEMRLLNELAGDISFALDHIQKTRKVDYLAYYDSLTGLANRTLLHERLAQNVSAAKAARSELGLVVLNIERFKKINDALGRQAGDAILREVAERLRRHTGDPGRLARVGANHFTVVISDTKAGALARELEALMSDIFGAPFHIGEEELRIPARAGVAVFPECGSSADVLFASAEAANKNAHSTGQRCVFYTAELTARVAESFSLENKLRRAVENEEFVLHYQPKISLETGKVIGVEALIRWQSPELGLVPPVRFIPLLEETGLILPVGSWALRQAAKDYCRWRESAAEAPRPAVNVSAIQLRQRDFVEAVEKATTVAAESGRVDVEITESLAMDDVQGNIPKLRALRELGIAIAIDDFGTGYSSLAYLAKLPVQSLKVDRSFISMMVGDANGTTLVSTIITLAHALGLKVCAEGVETEEQARLLKLLRCEWAQGYLYSKPLPPDEFMALLKSQAATAPKGSKAMS